MITLDTSAVIAAADVHDSNHVAATRAFSVRDVFVVPVGILAEIAYFFETRFSPTVLDAFLARLEDSTYLLDCGETDIARIRRLTQRYADLPLGYADAAVVACAERRGGRVLTFDHHFSVVAREGTIEVIPPLGA